MIFTTPRLLVRTAIPSDEDVDLYYRLWTDPRVMTNVGFPYGLRITREKMRQILETQSGTEYDRLLVIERRSDGQRLGECKLGKPDEHGIAETDVKLLPEYWGHSYGLEVKRGLLDYIFTHSDCSAVHATPNVENLPSIRMQEAVGGERIHEGVYEFPEHMREYTHPVHHYVYQVTRQTWTALPRVASATNITIQIKACHELTPTEQENLDGLLHRVFGYDPLGASMVWSKMDWYIWVCENDMLVSNVEIVERTITVDNRPLRVGGIGGVATLPEFRGRGLATQAMTAAARYMKEELRLDYGLLITGSSKKSLYAGMGWQEVSEAAYFDQPSGKMKNDGITMSLALTDKPWPAGEIDFCGFPW
jgi:RimJ/RimL family protein N-acetyltransferase